jgi:hypothetical protein
LRHAETITPNIHAIAGLAEQEAREAVKAGLRAQGPSPWTKAQLISLGWPCRSGYGLNYLIDIENAVGPDPPSLDIFCVTT